MKLNHSKPRIIAVLPIHNGLPLILDAIESIFQQKDPSFDLEIVVAACGSTDGSVETIRKLHPTVHVTLGSETLWWTGAMKIGTQEALRLEADFIFWMNHDDILGPNTISKLFEAARLNPRSIPCSVLASPDQENSVCGFEISYWKWYSKPKVFPLTESGADTFKVEADVNGGHGILIPREVFESTDKLDVLRPDLFPHYSGDFDFFMRAKKLNFKVLTVGGTLVKNNPKSTGILQGQRIQKWSQIPSYLFSRRSPCNLRDRPLFALVHFPPLINLIWSVVFLIAPVFCSLFFFVRKSKIGPLDYHPAKG